MTATPVYVGYGGVVDQIDLNPAFYFHSPVILEGTVVPWERATPIPYSYGPRMAPQMPPVKGS